MTQGQFEHLCKRLHSLCGINLKEGKEELVHARLNKRLNALNLKSFDQYFKLIDNDPKGDEIIWMIDALTTNKTSFFREIQHFDFLRDHILPGLKKKRLRIWSAACSSGEEPYSIAILLAECIPDFRSWDIKILGTDISVGILKKAHKAVYTDATLQPIPQSLRQKYFVPADPVDGDWKVVPKLRELVTFGRLNFLDPFPMKGPFDVIFCRNAMIYFDKQTQETLVRRFHDLIAPGGYLLVGHAESLTGAKHNFKYIAPATYQK